MHLSRSKLTQYLLSLLLLYCAYIFVFPPQASAAPPPGNWTLMFNDEFDGTFLNTTKWSTTYPWGSRTNAANNEAQYYADDAFTLSNGILKIRADKRSMGGFNYTSGIITSYGKFSQQYGYFEMGAQVPRGKGLWPAFWLLPNTWAWPPEIDILENIGSQPTTAYFTNHYGATNSPQANHGSYTGPDFSAGYHVFGLEWRPDALIWTVDGVERYRVTVGVPQEKMYIIANLAVGGKWPGYPDSTTTFPAYYNIDYIRAYTLNATTATVPAAPSNLYAKPYLSKRVNRWVRLTWQDNANNENGFEVWRSTSATSGFSRIKVVGSNTTSYNDYLGRYPLTSKYYYFIRSYNAAGPSANSNIIQINPF